MKKWHEGNENGIRLPAAHEEVLGIFLKDGKLFREYRLQLVPEMFGEYAWLYKILLETDDTEELTFRNVAVRCREHIELLHQLRNCVASVNVLPTLIQELRRKFVAAQILTSSREWYNKALENDCDPDEILRDMQEKAFSISSTEISGISDPDKDVDEWHQWITEITYDPSKALGLMTGLSDLDRITTGWHRTDFIVIGARTSIGKSAFLIDTVLRLTKNGYKCAIFSLEMSKKQIYNRMIANLMGISLEVLRTGQLAKERLSEIARYKDLLKQIYVDDTRGVSADYITDTMRMLKRTRGLDFVAVDYIQDVAERGEQNDNGGSALARVCRKLRAGAQFCDCAVMGLSQVTRDVEKRQDKRPAISDLSGSTGIETAADVIGMLYRDEYYDPNTPAKNIMEINFGKQRNGKVGKVEVYYDKESQRILPLERSARNQFGGVRTGTSSNV
ncbi:MAG: AAA family ATPase, partial [Acidobacterium ailaaui]|nr:AAA family ATPase [Pseudacidobacterium ailaaui]